MILSRDKKPLKAKHKARQVYIDRGLHGPEQEPEPLYIRPIPKPVARPKPPFVFKDKPYDDVSFMPVRRKTPARVCNRIVKLKRDNPSMSQVKIADKITKEGYPIGKALVHLILKRYQEQINKQEAGGG